MEAARGTSFGVGRACGRRLRKPFSVAPYIQHEDKRFDAGAAFRGVPIRD